MPRGYEDSPGRPTHLPTRNLPEDWLGVYKSLEEVPDRYRLANFEADLAGEDPFTEYLNTREDLSEWSREHKHGKAYRDFTTFMDDRDTHPACATPDDIEAFFRAARNGQWSTVEEREWSTLHATYLAPLKTAFNWIVHRVKYPHVYNPLLMAAAREGVTREIWLWKVAESSERWDRQKRGAPPRSTEENHE